MEHLLVVPRPWTRTTNKLLIMPAPVAMPHDRTALDSGRTRATFFCTNARAKHLRGRHLRVKDSASQYVAAAELRLTARGAKRPGSPWLPRFVYASTLDTRGNLSG